MIRTQLLAPSFPVEKMTELLDHDNLEMRAEFRKFISEPILLIRPLIGLNSTQQTRLNAIKASHWSILQVQHQPRGGKGVGAQEAAEDL